MLTASARSVPGTLRQQVLIDGHHMLFTDEPVRLGGEGSAPAPHELLPASVAACIGTTMQMYARTKGWAIDGLVVDVDYDPHSSPRRLTATVRVEGELTPEQRSRLEKAAATCPVHRAIEGGILFEESYDYPGTVAV